MNDLGYSTIRGVNRNTDIEFANWANTARRWQGKADNAARDGELRAVRILVLMMNEGFKTGHGVSADTEAYWRKRLATLEATL